MIPEWALDDYLDQIDAELIASWNDVDEKENINGD